MHAVGLKALKNRLAEYVRLAARGETVLITDRDRVVAELVPPREGRAAALADAQLAEMFRQGLVAPPLVRDPQPPPRAPVTDAATLLAGLAADRGER